MGSYKPISRIAIVGAGPVGVASAKYLIAEDAFETIDIFEQRGGVGGVWNLSGTERSRKIPVPQTDPRYGSKPLYGSRGSAADVEDAYSSQQSLEFESPLYDYLESNIPKQLMQYADRPFSDDDPLFVPHDGVLRYLENYAVDVEHLIHFNTQVEDIRLAEGSIPEHELWQVSTTDMSTGSRKCGTYDAVVIANGHYTVPSIPAIKGLEQWHKRYPGAVIHSKAYRRPQDFSGQKVMVIGNAASGVDIAAQVARRCKQPLLLSSRSASMFGPASTGMQREEVGQVVEFLPSSKGERAVQFQDGRIEEGIDVVIFATGYFYSYPFLSALSPPVITDGLRVKPTYQDIFNIEHPTLAFPVLNLKVIPFPLAQNEAAVIARVWSGRLQLPSKATMRQWEEDRIKEKGDGKYFHGKKFPEDAAQINELYRWAASAQSRQGLENNGRGKLGTMWKQRQVWLRSRFPELKAAYNQKGDARFKIRTIEELGFNFDEWLAHATPEDMRMFEQAKC